MNQNRELKIGIKSDNEFFDEFKELAGRIDDGWLPEKPVERVFPMNGICGDISSGG